jgi:isoleucyl-tRNA synthetase
MEEPDRHRSCPCFVSCLGPLYRIALTSRDGKKMSKKLKNYPDPMEIVNKYGADAVRLFLVNSPVVRGDNLRFREEGVREILTNVLLKWINSLNFYLGQVELYERASGKKFVNDHDAPKSKNVMDRWILASCQTLIQHVDQEMAGELLYSLQVTETDY